jgi:hypothetical protein
MYVIIQMMIIYKVFLIFLESRLRTWSWPNLGQLVLLRVTDKGTVVSTMV